MNILFLSRQEEKFKAFQITMALSKHEVDFRTEIEPISHRLIQSFDYIIFDSDSFTPEQFRNLNSMVPYGKLIYLSQYMDWEKIIDSFEKNYFYYPKPIRANDFD